MTELICHLVRAGATRLRCSTGRCSTAVAGCVELVAARGTLFVVLSGRLRPGRASSTVLRCDAAASSTRSCVSAACGCGCGANGAIACRFFVTDKAHTGMCRIVVICRNCGNLTCV